MSIQSNQQIYDVSMAETSLRFGDLEVAHEAAPKRSISGRIKAFVISAFRGLIKSRQESANRYIAMHKDDYKW